MKIYVVKILDISESELNNLTRYIDAEKKYKINKFINKKDKIRSLISEILIRNIIFENLNINSRDIIFEKNVQGKPYLKGYSNFNFNLSHSGDFVVCAIDNKPIGIDIEKIESIDHKGIAQSFFSKDECDFILKGDLQAQIDKFYEIWTLKESYIKADGRGLTIPLKSFSINIDEYENIELITKNELKKCNFKKFNIESEYKMAVCSLNKGIPNNIITINQKCLIDSYLKDI